MSDTANDGTENSDKVQDLKNRLKQFAQPIVDSLDTRLREQVDARVDARVDATLASRLAVIERAIADLDRSIRSLELRLDHTDD